MTSSRRIKTIILVASLATVLLCVLPLAIRVGASYQYSKELDAVIKEILIMEKELRPANVNANAWKAASTWTIIACQNVFFTNETTPIVELRRFRADIEKCLKGDVDLATFDWIWKRLAETGTPGQKYHNKFEPYYRASVNEALANMQSPQTEKIENSHSPDAEEQDQSR